MATKGAKNEVALKVWASWEDGVGYLYDEQGINGLYYANAILGLRGELRPAPAFMGTSAAPLTEIDITDGVSTRSAITGLTSAQYFFEEITTDVAVSNEAYLYPIINNDGRLSGAAIGDAVYKMDMRFATFGAYLSEGFSNGSANDPLGSPMRYQGQWFVPGANDIRRLTTVAAAGAADTWTASSAGGSPTSADHLALLNFQGTKVKRGSGSSLLATNGDPLLDTAWGSYNQVGDKNERALGIQNLADAMFIFNKEGLYSFNDKVQSGLVFGDFRHWRNVLREAAIVPFKGGLILGHPTGLQFYQPRNLPVAIGPDSNPASTGLGPPGGPTEFSNGRWHGVSVAGDYIYAVYQPTPTGGSGIGTGTARNALILFGTPKGMADPTDITWQVVGSTNLQSKSLFSTCFVSTLGYPEVSDQPSPTLWVNSSNSAASTLTLKRMNLDNRATPFRSRLETHRVVNNITEGTTAAECWLSELMFPQPVELTRLVVYTQDMVFLSGTEGPDCWKFSVLLNGAPEQASAISGISSLADIAVGRINRNGRTEIELNHQDIHRLMLHIAFQSTIGSATGSVNRVAPSIKRIELWGRA